MGIRDEGGLYQSVYKILKSRIKYANDPFSLAAFVYQEIARKHHFVDGNKRTAHVYAKLMLYLSGYVFKLEYKLATLFIMKIAEHNSQVTFQEIKEWAEKNSKKIESYEDLANYLNTKLFT